VLVHTNGHSMTLISAILLQQMVKLIHQD